MANRRRARIGRMKANSTSAVPSSPASLGRRRISESLGDGRQRTREVHADSRQDRDRDQSDEQQDERVLDQRLPFLLAERNKPCAHPNSPPPPRIERPFREARGRPAYGSREPRLLRR